MVLKLFHLAAPLTYCPITGCGCPLGQKSYTLNRVVRFFFEDSTPPLSGFHSSLRSHCSLFEEHWHSGSGVGLRFGRSRLKLQSSHCTSWVTLGQPLFLSICLTELLWGQSEGRNYVHHSDLHGRRAVFWKTLQKRYQGSHWPYDTSKYSCPCHLQVWHLHIWLNEPAPEGPQNAPQRHWKGTSRFWFFLRLCAVQQLYKWAGWGSRADAYNMCRGQGGHDWNFKHPARLMTQY